MNLEPEIKGAPISFSLHCNTTLTIQSNFLKELVNHLGSSPNMNRQKQNRKHSENEIHLSTHQDTHTVTNNYRGIRNVRVGQHADHGPCPVCWLSAEGKASFP